MNGDKLQDLVMLDPEGYLALYPRAKKEDKLVLLPPERVFVNEKGEPLRLTCENCRRQRAAQALFGRLGW